MADLEAFVREIRYGMPDITALKAPSGLAATATETSVSLSWTASENAANYWELNVDQLDSGTTLAYALDREGYYIERAVSPFTTWLRIATVGFDQTTYTDSTVSASTTYRYRVQAFNIYQETAYTTAVEVSTSVSTSLVAPVVSVSMGPTAALLSWADTSTGEDGFVVEQCQGAGCTSWAILSPVAATNATSYSVTGLTAGGTTYRWRVRARAGTSYSAYSTPVSGTTTALPTGDHAYFDGLVALPWHFVSYSLRSQAQLDSLTNLGTSNYFTYDVANDTYAFPQDAAKFYKSADSAIGAPSDSIPGNQQLKMPIGINSGTVLITFDFWYGQEFRTNRGTVGNYKIWQVRQDTNRWWTHVNRFALATDPTEICKTFDSMDGNNFPVWPAGVTRREPYTPSGAGSVTQRTYPIFWNTWTRYWYYIELSVPSTDPRWNDWKSQNVDTAALSGTYHMLSLWIGDETRAPSRMVYRVPWNIRAGSDISSFDFEFNTSTVPPAQTGPLIGYGRNVVVLHNYQLPTVPETDTTIFALP